MNATDRSRTRIPLLLAIAAAAVVAAVVGIAATGNGDRAGDPAAAERTRLGPPAPDLTFEFFDGTTATLAHYQGRPLVVNFWASWCPSCVAEMSAAFRPVQQRLGGDVDFVGFNIQDERSKALQLVEETGVLFDLAEDPQGDLYTAFGGIGMPFTVFISENGEVLHEHNGPVTESQLTDLINEKLLGA